MDQISRTSILIVEDHTEFAKFLKEILQDEYLLETAENAEIALEKFRQMRFDLVLLDLGLPRRADTPAEILGFDLLKTMKKLDRFVEIIILTGTSREVDHAIRAIKDGAYYFLIKDDYDKFAEKLKMTLSKALEVRNLQRKNDALRKQAKYMAEVQKRVHKYLHPKLHYHFGFMLGESEEMHKIYAIIKKLHERKTEETVVIYGENGTGKEMAAHSIHANSPRSDNPWIVSNISALPPELIESELFGIEEKIATDVKKRIGYFEQAHGTTIFLDEIGEITAGVQVKLLRVLQNYEIQKIGSTKPIPVDVRVIAATNRNLEELIAQGKFREDLYYRLEVISMTMPPLRKRKEDIPLLTKHILFEIQQEEKNPHIRITDEAIAFLQDYHWPGNVRQLQNILKKAAILRSADTLQVDDFKNALPAFEKTATNNNHTPVHLPNQQILMRDFGTTDFKDIPDVQVRNRLFLRTLIEHEGLMETVLERLGIARNTAYKYLEEAQLLLLSGFCQVDAETGNLAILWGVDAQKLEKTIRRANRLSNYYNELMKRFDHDLARVAAYLNLEPEKLRYMNRILGSQR